MANENSISSDLIRGHIDTIILRSLYDNDKHGNEICLDIESKSGGQYEMKQPTLYSALKRLETSGLVKAYWSSGVGGRRRYYKLTDEGKKVCEENFNLWIHSRNVIDKLISDGGDLGYPEIEPVPVKPKFDPSEYENYTFSPISDDDFDEPDLTDYQAIIEQPEQPLVDDAPILKSVDDSDDQTKILAAENENILNNLDSSEEIAVTQLSLINEEPEVVEDTIEDVIVETSSVEIIVEEPDEDVEEKQIINENFDGEDDSFVLDPFSTPEKKYSETLRQLYPSAEPDPVIVLEQPTEVEIQPVEKTEKEDLSNYELNTNTVTVTTDKSVIPESVPEIEKNESRTIKEANKNSNEIDYTDIISLAKMQGFRVKTADKTNHAVKGKLFINKLVALSASILFGIMIIEMLATCLPLNDILGLTWIGYLWIVAGLVCFPIVTYIVLLVNPKKTVDKLPSMKYSVTASIVAILNLILLTFAFALLMQIDFYNSKQLLCYIILPIILYLNIPLYFIIKYMLVSKEVYFTKK